METPKIMEPGQIGQIITKSLGSVEMMSAKKLSLFSLQYDDRCHLTLSAEDENFLKKWNPDNQSVYCSQANLPRCYTGSAPTLNDVVKERGAGLAANWLVLQINNLANFSGVMNKLNENQYKDLARLIIEEYGFLKLTEMMHFFWLYKKGEFLEFYGSVDPIAIMKSLKLFMPIRRNNIDKFEAPALEKAKQKEQYYRNIHLQTWRKFLKEYNLEFDIETALEIYWLTRM